MTDPATIEPTALTRAAPALDLRTREAVGDLVLSMADDEFVSGFTDS